MNFNSKVYCYLLLLVGTIALNYTKHSWCDEVELTLKNISSDKSLYYSVGTQVKRAPSWWDTIWGTHGNITFIARSFKEIKAGNTVKEAMPSVSYSQLCKDKNINSCSVFNDLNASTRAELKRQLGSSNNAFDALTPVIVFSWSKEFFDGGYDSEAKPFFYSNTEIKSTGAFILEYQEPETKMRATAETHYFDVVEWKNIGANLTAGFSNLTRRWRLDKEPANIEVVHYNEIAIPTTITIKNYASFPVYSVILLCKEDLNDLFGVSQECKYFPQSELKLQQFWKTPSDKKDVINETIINVNFDIRARDYFVSRPKEFSGLDSNNPYKVVVVTSPFLEDIFEKPAHTLSAGRTVLTNTRFHRIASEDIFSVKNNNFYVYQSEKGIGYFFGDYISTDITRKVINKFANIATPLGGYVPVIGSTIDQMLKYTKSGQQVEAKVIDRSDENHALSDGEKESLSKRKEMILEYLKNNVSNKKRSYLPKSIDINDVKADMIPNVGFAASGGGYRAALATLGFKNALIRSGIDPLLLYQAGLSGSTWYLSKYLQDAKTFLSDPLQAKNIKPGVPALGSEFYGSFYDDLRVRPKNNSEITKFLSFPNSPTGQQDLAMEFIAPWILKWAHVQPWTLVDLMGSGLWYNLFRENDPFSLRLSGFGDLMKTGHVPFTLMTSVTKTDSMEKDDYLWFEFSPFEIGATLYNRYVQTEHFGRHYINGRSVEVAPEMLLQNLMGIWGSAMTAGLLDGMRQGVVPATLTLQISTELPFFGELINYLKKDFSEISTLAAILSKHDLDKSDVREVIRYGIGYLDRVVFPGAQPAFKEKLVKLKARLNDTAHRLPGTLELTRDIDELYWLFNDYVKPVADKVYAAQPIWFKPFSKKLSTAKKMTDLQALSGGIVGNPYYDLGFAENVTGELPTLELRDGGVDFNVPFPPLLRNARKMDIIVVFDASPDTLVEVKALRGGCEYAKRHKISRFPADECLEIFQENAKLTSLRESPYTIIGNPDSLDNMTIIYVPLKKIANAGNYELGENNRYKRFDYSQYDPHNEYTATMNLRYTENQVDELAGFSDLLGEIASEAIHDVFGKKLRKKMSVHR